MMQILHQCAGCPNLIPVTDRKCAVCASPLVLNLDRRIVQRRELVIWDYATDRRCNDRRKDTAEWLSDHDRLNSPKRFRP